MPTERCAASCAILLAVWWLLGASPQETVFLVPGEGIPGVIMVGMDERRITEEARTFLAERGIVWRTDSPDNAAAGDDSTRAAAGGTTVRVIIIYSEQPGSVTDRNVGVGSSVKSVYRRYGRPLQTETRKAGEVLLYDGVAFTVENGRVVGLYVFAREKARD